MAPPLLQLTDIALTFGGTPLLTGADLSVSTGERVSLVGRNGSGKSTLLKIAAGLIEPDRGSVFVQPGTVVRYLPQEPASTRAYVEAGLRTYRNTTPWPEEVNRRAIALIANLHFAPTRIARDNLAEERLGGEVFVTGFERAEMGASRDLLGNDVAELLVSTAGRVGTERAVDTLLDTLGDAPATDAIPRLQPLALSRPSRKAVAGTSVITRPSA